MIYIIRDDILEGRLDAKKLKEGIALIYCYKNGSFSGMSSVLVQKPSAFGIERRCEMDHIYHDHMITVMRRGDAYTVKLWREVNQEEIERIVPTSELDITRPYKLMELFEGYD